MSNIKNDLLNIKTGEDWNRFIKKYKNIAINEWDEEMKEAFSVFMIKFKEEEDYDYRKIK